MLWVTVGGKGYALAYNHSAERIEIRDGKQNGPVLHSFDDSTPVADVEAVFRAL